jgi:hypothetical protein
MSDEQKKAYTANWIVKLNNKSYVAGINEKPLYLSKSEAKALLAIGAITVIDKSNL